MNLDFEKYADGLIPAVIQDDKTSKVLMVGFMDRKALRKTKKSGKATFFSRTNKKLWTKGEKSGNYLEVVDIIADCDNDTLLIKANPAGPTCHTGADTCFREKNKSGYFVAELERVINKRKRKPKVRSHTSRLFKRGAAQIAKKVGEEAVELVIEAMGDDDELFAEEAADLLYHYLVLLADRDLELEDVVERLRKRRG